MANPKDKNSLPFDPPFTSDLIKAISEPFFCELCLEATSGSSNGPLCNCITRVCTYCKDRYKTRRYEETHLCADELIAREAIRQQAAYAVDEAGIDLKCFPAIKKPLVEMAVQTRSEAEPGKQLAVFPSTGDRDLDKMIGDVINTIGTKGKEYTVGDSDRLKNFKRAAEKISRRKNRQPMDMVDVWQIFFDKHMSAVEAYIANGFEVQSNEPISGRIMDCIVYLILFYKMTVEIEGKKTEKKPVRRNGGPSTAG